MSAITPTELSVADREIAKMNGWNGHTTFELERGRFRAQGSLAPDGVLEIFVKRKGGSFLIPGRALPGSKDFSREKLRAWLEGKVRRGWKVAVLFEY